LESVEDDNERSFKEKEKQIALITEAILTDQLSGTWLNSYNEDAPYSVIAHPTADFDDIRNGADLVLEVFNKRKEQAQHLGLSIDITFSSNEANLTKKMTRIIDDIKAGDKRHSQIKYFESDFDEYKGSVDIARSVVVLSRDTVENLCKKEFSKDKEALSNHSVQLSLVAQLEEQAQTFLDLCQKYDNQRLASVYEEVLKNIQFLKREKREVFSDIEQDPVSIQEQYKGLQLLHRSLVKSLT
jgi:hypothetical protein